MAKKEALIVVAYLLLAQAASAGLESFGPVSLYVPNGWSCQSVEESFVCTDKSNLSQKNTAIVVNFKRRSPQDSLSVYKDQLSRPRPLQQNEVNFMSQPKGTRELTIGEHKWIEGIHFGAEIPDYYTHYYATVTSDFAVLVSISSQQSIYSSWMPLMKQTVDSLRINSKKESTSAQVTSSNAQPKQSTQVKSNKIQIFDYSVSWQYLALGIGGLVVLSLLGYAIFSK